MAHAGFAHEPPSGTAKTVDWWTPAWVFEALGLAFDLDPCSPLGGVPWLPAKRHYSLPTNGLTEPWEGRVWCNPPYGPETAKWLAKMNSHRNGVALVFARTDTIWFHDSVAEADAILFLKGRISFVPGKNRALDRPNAPGAGSMLVAWGAENVEALAKMADEYGYLVRR